MEFRKIRNRTNSASVLFRIAEIRRKKSLLRLRGFTLAELIVVITILAILATIGFLSLSGYSSDARSAATASNVRSTYSAISAESALTGYSPRYYVIHSALASLSGAYVYVDGNSTTLTGGDWNVDGTNYSAGNPDFAKLKLNPDKFKVSMTGLPSSVASLLPSALAVYGPGSYDRDYPSVGAMDSSYDSSSTGRKRVVSYFQVAGISPSTNKAAVVGNYPSTLSVSGSSVGLIAADPGTSSTGALVDNAVTVPSSEATPPVPEETPPSSSFAVSGSFGSNADGAAITGCGKSATADASGNFSLTVDSGVACNDFFAARPWYVCSTTTNGPASVTANVTNIAGSCSSSSATYVNIDGSTTTYIPDSANGSTRFVFTGPSQKIVYDNITGLRWESQYPTVSETTYTWDDAKAYCAALTLDGLSAWRLPDYTELQSIVDYSKASSPAIDTAFFTAQSAAYWSSTGYAPNTAQAWWVLFFNGNSNGYNNKTDVHYVRCVR